MAPLLHLAAGLLALAAQTSAHFLLNYPATAGFSDDDEPTAPCGSFSIGPNTNITDFHVGGDVISLTSTHPQVTYLFRITPDTHVDSNFTQLLSPVQQDGLGQFCEPSVAVPASFAGSKGVLQIVTDSPDGVLYQCALLNFVSGTGQGASTANSNCKNATGVSASFVADTTLSAAVSRGTSTSSMSMSGTSSMSGMSSTSTSSSSAKASSAAAPGVSAGMGGAVSVMLFAGIALVAGAVSLL